MARRHVPAGSATDGDDPDVADWFNTETDPAIAQAVAKAEAIARQPVDGSGTPPELTR